MKQSRDTYSKEGMKPRLWAIAANDCLFGLLKVVDEIRVEFSQLICLRAQ